MASMIGSQSAGSATPTASKQPSGSSRQATLILVIDNVQSDELSFEQEITIGRHSTCDIQIQSKFISRQHAVIKRNENEQYVLHHLSSTNPSVVNGEPITSGDRVLRDKDVLIFADKTFYFRAPPATVPSPSPCVKLAPVAFVKHQPTLETIDEGTSCSMEDLSGKKSLDNPPPPPLTAEEIDAAGGSGKRTMMLPLSIKAAIELRRQSAGSSSPSASGAKSGGSPAVRTVTPGRMAQVSTAPSRNKLPSPLKAQIQSLAQKAPKSATKKSKTPVKAAVSAKRSLNTPLKNAIQRLRKSFGGSGGKALSESAEKPAAKAQPETAPRPGGMSAALLRAIEARHQREEELDAMAQQTQSPATTTAHVEAITPRVLTQQSRVLQVPKAPEEAAMAEKRHGLPPGLREAILGRRRKSLSSEVASSGRKSLRKSLSTKTPAKAKGGESGAEMSQLHRPKALPTPVREGIHAARRLSLRQQVQQRHVVAEAEATDEAPAAVDAAESPAAAATTTAAAAEDDAHSDDDAGADEAHGETPRSSEDLEDRALFADDCLLAATVQISALAMVQELADEHPLIAQASPAPSERPVTLDDAVACILSPAAQPSSTVQLPRTVGGSGGRSSLSLPASASRVSASKAGVLTPYAAPTTGNAAEVLATPALASVKKRLSLASASKEAAQTPAVAVDPADEDDAAAVAATAAADEDTDAATVASAAGDANDAHSAAAAAPRGRTDVLQSLEKRGRARVDAAEAEDGEVSAIDWVQQLTDMDLQMIQIYAQQLLPASEVAADDASVDEEQLEEQAQEMYALALDAYIRGMEFAHQQRQTSQASAVSGGAAAATRTGDAPVSARKTTATATATGATTLADLFRLPMDYIDASYADIDGDLVELYAQEIMAAAHVDESVAFGVALDAFLADPVEFRHRVGRLALPHLEPIHFLADDEDGAAAVGDDEGDAEDGAVASGAASDDDDDDRNDDEASAEGERSTLATAEAFAAAPVPVTTPRHQRRSSEAIELTSHKKGKQIHEEHPRRISLTSRLSQHSASKLAVRMGDEDEDGDEGGALEPPHGLVISAMPTPSSQQPSLSFPLSSAQEAAAVPLPPSTVKKAARRSRGASEDATAVGFEAGEAEEAASTRKRPRQSLATQAAAVPLPPSTVKKPRRAAAEAMTPGSAANQALAAEAALVPLPASAVKTPAPSRSTRRSRDAAEASAVPDQAQAVAAAQVPLPPSATKTPAAAATRTPRVSDAHNARAAVAAAVPLPPSTAKKAASRRGSLRGDEAAAPEPEPEPLQAATVVAHGVAAESDAEAEAAEPVASSSRRGKKSAAVVAKATKKAASSAAAEEAEEAVAAPAAKAPTTAAARRGGRKATAAEVVEAAPSSSSSRHPPHDAVEEQPPAAKVAAKKRSRATSAPEDDAGPATVAAEAVAVVAEPPVEATTKKRGTRAAAAPPSATVAAPPDEPPATKPKKEPAATTKKAAARGSRKPAASAAAAASDAEDSDMEEVTVILCDGCDAEFVLQDIGLTRVPKGDWFCAACASARSSKKAAGASRGAAKATSSSDDAKAEEAGPAKAAKAPASRKRGAADAVEEAATEPSDPPATNKRSKKAAAPAPTAEDKAPARSTRSSRK